MRTPVAIPLAYKGKHDTAGRYPVGYVVGEDGEKVSRA